MNPPSHTTPTNQPQLRSSIYTSYIKPSRLLYSMIWLSLKFQIRPDRGPTSSSTNHLLRGYPCNHLTICTSTKRILLTIDPDYHTRTHVINLPIMTPSYNMIHLYPSRN
uniref:Uncharacterized protein n=1 Tax=Rhinolophus ferrumequinum TaxID=59479 RepID=A0A671G2A9_RHIFE